MKYGVPLRGADPEDLRMTGTSPLSPPRITPLLTPPRGRVLTLSPTLAPAAMMSKTSRA